MNGATVQDTKAVIAMAIALGERLTSDVVNAARTAIDKGDRVPAITGAIGEGDKAIPYTMFIEGNPIAQARESPPAVTGRGDFPYRLRIVTPDARALKRLITAMSPEVEFVSQVLRAYPIPRVDGDTLVLVFAA